MASTSTSSAVDIIVSSSATTTSATSIRTSFSTLEDSPSNTNTKVISLSSRSSSSTNVTSPTTSSSDKRTTKLSTSSINESTNLNSPSASPTTTTSSTSGKTTLPVEVSPSTTSNKSTVSLPSSYKKLNSDDDYDDEDNTKTTITAATTTTAVDDSNEMKLKNVKNKNDCQNAPSSSSNFSDEDLTELSSLQSSNLSSSSGDNKITIGIGIGSNGGNIKNCINALGKGNGGSKSINAMLEIAPILPSLTITTMPNASTRKRGHNRRKSSDPVAVKKYPRMVEHFHDDNCEPFCYMEKTTQVDGMEIEEEDYEEEILSNDEDLYVESAARLRGRSSIPLLRNIIDNQATRKGQPGVPTLKEFHRGVPLRNEYIPSHQERVINSSNDKCEIRVTPSEEEGHYNIKWNNHSTQLLLAFESSVQNETFCDVTLVCDYDEDYENDVLETEVRGHTIPGGESNPLNERVEVIQMKAHKIVLAACSEYFQRILAENPCKHSVIVLKEYKAWEVKAVLDFMYRGEVEISLERLSVLVKTAESLQIRGLIDSLSPELLKLNQEFLSNPNLSSGDRDNHLYLNNNNNNNNKYYRKSSDTEDLAGIGGEITAAGNCGNFEESVILRTEALNLSMDSSIKLKSSPEIELPKSEGKTVGKPQNLVEEEISKYRNESDSFPTASANTKTNIGTTTTTDLSVVATSLKTPNNHNNNNNHELQHANQNLYGRNRYLQPEDCQEKNCNEINQNHIAEFKNQHGRQEYGLREHILGLREQPRRKQARPQRTSGNFIAQEVRKLIPPSPLALKFESLSPELLESQDHPHQNLHTRRLQPDNHIQDDEEINSLNKDETINPPVPRDDDDDLDFQSPPRHHRHTSRNQEDQNSRRRDDDDDDNNEGPRRTRGSGTLMTRLGHRKRTSKRFNQSRDLHLRSPINLRNNRSTRSNNSNNNNLNNNIEEDRNNVRTEREKISNNEESGKNTRNNIDEDQEQLIQNGVLDYTIGMYPGGNKKFFENQRDLLFRGMVGSGNRNTPNTSVPHFDHMPFFPHWSPNLGASIDNANDPQPPGMQRPSSKPGGDSDEEISSTADQCKPTSETPESKHFMSHLRHNHNPHDFPMFGLHSDNQSHNLPRQNPPSSLSLNRHSPSSPSSFFLGHMGPMSGTPLGGGGGEEPGVDTPSTPPDLFSSPGFPLLPLPFNQGNNHGHPSGPPHHIHGLHRRREERDGGGSNSSSDRVLNGRIGKDASTRGNPSGWLALPPGAQPIFGRHRAQHSAPRGGPPRSWSNDDLTEALHQVWNKRMTTSQASRNFGIPYNSLLMYVRGKYGKSLKLDVLKKGLDMAMENSTTRRSSNNNNNPPGSPLNVDPPGTEPLSSGALRSNTPNTSNNLAVASPVSTVSNSASSTPPSIKGHSGTTGGNNITNTGEHNNLSSTSTGMGRHHHNHQHHNSHSNSNKSSSKSANASAHHNNNHNANSNNNHHHHHGGRLEIPPDFPPGFNPLAASIFSNYPGPFPFASALSHILPPGSLVNPQHHQQQQLGHALPGLGGLRALSNHSERSDETNVEEEEDDK